VFLLVPAYPGSPETKAVKRLLLLGKISENLGEGGRQIFLTHTVYLVKLSKLSETKVIPLNISHQKFNLSVQFFKAICSPEKHRRRSSLDSTRCCDAANTALLLVDRLDEQSLL